jgi:predicted DNA binding protein
MSLIAEFRVQSPDIALGSALTDVPAIRLDLIQEVGTDPQRPSLFIWASDGDIERFEERARADETVANVERYLTLDHKVLFRMRVTEAAKLVSYPVWVEAGGEQLEAHFADGWWHNRMRFPDREALSTIRDWCEEVGITFVLDRIYTNAEAKTPELTHAQREALQAAYDAGYFEVPRSASMADLAERLDISAQAVSERLRRAHQTLVARYFDTPPVS